MKCNVNKMKNPSLISPPLNTALSAMPSLKSHISDMFPSLVSPPSLISPSL